MKIPPCYNCYSLIARKGEDVPPTPMYAPEFFFFSCELPVCRSLAWRELILIMCMSSLCNKSIWTLAFPRPASVGNAARSTGRAEEETSCFRCLLFPGACSPLRAGSSLFYLPLRFIRINESVFSLTVRFLRLHPRKTLAIVISGAGKKCAPGRLWPRDSPQPC